MLQQWRQQRNKNTNTQSHSHTSHIVVVCHGAILNAAGEYGHRALGIGQRKTNEGQLSQFKFNKLMYYVQEVTSRTRLAMIHIYMQTDCEEGGSGNWTGIVEKYLYFFGGGKHFDETAATEG